MCAFREIKAIEVEKENFRSVNNKSISFVEGVGTLPKKEVAVFLEM